MLFFKKNKIFQNYTKLLVKEIILKNLENLVHNFKEQRPLAYCAKLTTFLQIVKKNGYYYSDALYFPIEPDASSMSPHRSSSRLCIHR